MTDELTTLWVETTHKNLVLLLYQETMFQENRLHYQVAEQVVSIVVYVDDLLMIKVVKAIRNAIVYLWPIF